MSRPLSVLAFAALAACGPRATLTAQRPAPPAPPGPGDGPTLEAVVDSVIRTPPLDRAQWGIEVYDATAGAILLQRDAHRLFVPASNLKLATVAAALELLGPDYRFRTDVVAFGPGGGGLDSLVVMGSGDPTFSRIFHDDPLAPLDSLADSLAAAGVRTVRGPIVVDQSRFDSTLVNPTWETSDLDWYYAAPVAPFAVLESAIPVVLVPGRVGRAARVHVLAPRGLVPVDADVRTVAGRRPWDDELRRVPGPDSLILRGEIGAGAGPDTSWIAQTDPGRLAGEAFRRALDRAGIDVAGPVIVRYRATPREDGAAVATWRSPPLAAIVRPTLERSDNWMTEQLLKTLGAERGGDGSWSAGTAVVEGFLTDTVGIDPDAIYMRDGSGLTPQDLWTPHAIVTLLRWVRSRPWADDFRTALAEPGEPESTLEDRLGDVAGRVLGKTGTLRHINAFSGYAITPDGRELVFSILNNAAVRPSWEVHRAVDRIVDALLENGSN